MWCAHILYTDLEASLWLTAGDFFFYTSHKSHRLCWTLTTLNFYFKHERSSWPWTHTYMHTWLHLLRVNTVRSLIHTCLCILKAHLIYILMVGSIWTWNYRVLSRKNTPFTWISNSEEVHQHWCEKSDSASPVHKTWWQLQCQTVHKHVCQLCLIKSLDHTGSSNSPYACEVIRVWKFQPSFMWQRCYTCYKRLFYSRRWVAKPKHLEDSQ